MNANQSDPAGTVHRIALMLLLALAGPLPAAWAPAKGPLLTRWAKEVAPDRCLPEYPRPTMVREDWLNLNGLWDYAIAPKEEKAPAQYQGQILVPFPIESALSGVMKPVGDANRLWYRRTVTIPAGWQGKNVLLHFGAVDWEAVVYVNGKEVGQHRGGYDAFSFDITAALKPSGEQEIIVAVWDPTDTGTQPRGKQIRNPRGIWYTAVTGIWQTPWLEPVQPVSVESLKLAPDFDAGTVQVTVLARGDAAGANIQAAILDGGKEVARGRGAAGKPITVKIPNAKAWTPDNPFLYDVKVVLSKGKITDEVASYVGLRKISLGKDDKGFVRLMLNNEVLFQHGPLDQGWWPDGLYTAPTDAALKYDIEVTKQLGFNMARKHVKVEPERWYYWCDKLGLLVWQDMPSGDKYIRGADPDITRTPESGAQFELELRQMIEERFNHPSIVMWVPYNEGWGQWDTARICDLVKQWDPTRLVNNASGWTDRGAGDVHDIHTYPGPNAPPPESKRAGVLGEFGGLGLPVKGHTWQDEKNWGYRSYTNSTELTRAYVSLIKKLHPLIGTHGLSAAVYTQTTDVEVEVNGLMTYDRALIKMNAAEITAANKTVYLPPPPPPVTQTLSPTSQGRGVPWRFVTEKPADDWMQPEYNDAGWRRGAGGFGTTNTPRSQVRTVWNSSDIWLRRTFEVPAGFKPGNLQLVTYHDEDAEVYLNGKLVASLANNNTRYENHALDRRAVEALKLGVNVLAVHCKQVRGGQYIDVGLLNEIEVVASPAPPPPGVSVRAQVEAVGRNAHYVGNRAPLVPSPLVKLPIGSITLRGWLRHMLELEKAGMTGRLKEISRWLKFEESAWADKAGKGHSGWEELPYWLKGYGDLGYVLKDEAVINEARKWIEPMFASQDETGWFGPRELQASLKGKADLWPHMVMLNVLQSYYESTGDERVITCMTRYFKWQHQLPPAAFGEGYWPRIRMGDNIESIYWLYNRTGEAWLLDLARKIHENMQDWMTGVHNWHNVNIAQGFRASSVYFLQTHDLYHRDAADRNYREVMGTYGQFAGGGFVGDENSRPGFIDPRGGIETCGIVEFTHSFQMLTRITGDPIWSERCEEIAFNAFPAAMTPDLKGLRYITSANQVQADRHNKAPGIQNSGTMFSFSPFEVYRCCQHNVSHGWPYYAEELWLATSDNGLCASLYGECEVRAKAGETGTQVTVSEVTDYPFSESILFRVNPARPVTFPLYLRVPQWCVKPSLRINGREVAVQAGPLSYIVINREWQKNDMVSLELPMQIAVRTWKANKDAVSVHYGPLAYSLKIGERWEKYGNRHADWPEWEVFAATPWNYGLVLNPRDPAQSFEVVKKEGALPPQPWTADTVTISLKAKAKKIPGWQLDRLGMVAPLQPSPVKSDEPEETVTLIPMGAARLRIASFPTIGSGANAREWVAPAQPKASPFTPTASHVHDDLFALNDGIEPSNSNDQSIPRFTWWDHRGTKEWAQYTFDKPRKISGVAVYWFDDTGVGQCRVPASWRILYQASNEWKAVEPAAEPGVKKDALNEVQFAPVEATGLRLEVQFQPTFSSGILEWKVKE